jgi:hypothetical protein
VQIPPLLLLNLFVVVDMFSIGLRVCVLKSHPAVPRQNRTKKWLISLFPARKRLTPQGA